MTDSVSTTLRRAFDDALFPRLQQLGFSSTKLKRTKPGLVVAAAERALGADRRLTATLWCDAAGTNLRFRFDVVEPINGVECTRQLDLAVPWPDPSYPKPRSLDFSGKDFRPEAGLDRLERAVTFLAGAFAASVASAQVPELHDAVQAATATREWTDAIARARTLWDQRFD